MSFQRAIKMYDYPVENAALQDLFDPNLPNSPALWAVLKGNHTGKAVVDSRQNPSQCMVRTDASLSYISHQIEQDFLDQAINYFRRVGPVWLVWPYSTSLRPPGLQDAVMVNRIEFYEYDPSSNILTKLKRQLPEGHEIRGINYQLLERGEWRSEIEFYAGSLSNLLEHGIGLYMMREDEIVVEAYASALGKTRAEIGAITREAYRGRGYAPIACAFLIDACEQRGYQAYWSCDADHQASIRVAQKLGFEQERGYQIFEYDIQK